MIICPEKPKNQSCYQGRKKKIWNASRICVSSLRYFPPNVLWEIGLLGNWDFGICFQYGVVEWSWRCKGEYFLFKADTILKSVACNIERSQAELTFIILYYVVRLI